MFDRLKSRWAEARADVARKELDDILNRYERFDRGDKYWVFSAFRDVSNSVQEDIGEIKDIPATQKKLIAKSIAEDSRQAARQTQDSIHGHTSRIGAMGGYLVSLYIEAQTLPGSEAERIINSIEKWRDEAAVALGE
jgi:hypothetical protein